MKISKQSMHYKFIVNNDIDCVYYKSVENNICGYTRQFLSQLIKCITAYGIMLWLAHAMLIAPLSWFGLWQAPFESDTGYAGIVSSGGSIMWGIAAVVCILVAVDKLHTMIKERTKNSKQEKVYPVFVQAIIDKHNKFCRNLEFTD